MLAIIKTGGKQYKVEEGDKITFDEVLFTGDDKSVTVGTPIADKASVEGIILAQDRHAKIWGIKHKAKKRYKKKYGHRQAYTEIEMTKIG